MPVPEARCSTEIGGPCPERKNGDCQENSSIPLEGVDVFCPTLRSESASMDLPMEPDIQDSDEETAENPVQTAGKYSPVRLRRNVHPPKRLTYDMLGESSKELIHTIRTQAPIFTPPTVNWVGCNSALTPIDGTQKLPWPVQKPSLN